MRKRILALLLLAVMLTAVGCKNNENENGETEDTIGKIAVITGDREPEMDTRIAQIIEGVNAAGKDDTKLYTPEAMTEEALKVCFDAAAEDQAALVLCAGNEMAPGIAYAKEKYPDMHVIVIDADENTVKPEKNVCTVTFRREQSGYLAGYGAVRDGTLNIGFFGQKKDAATDRYQAGFAAGVNDAASLMGFSVELRLGTYRDFKDDDEMLAWCEGWLNTGTEIVMAHADDDFMLRLAEITLEQEGNSYLIGTDYDTTYLLELDYDFSPFLSCALVNWQEATGSLLEMVSAGSWETGMAGKTLTLGLEDGNYLSLPDSADVMWFFKDYSLEEYAEMREKIAAGEIKVPSDGLPEFNTELVTVKEFIPAEA